MRIVLVACVLLAGCALGASQNQCGRLADEVHKASSAMSQISKDAGDAAAEAKEARTTTNNTLGFINDHLAAIAGALADLAGYVREQQNLNAQHDFNGSR